MICAWFLNHSLRWFLVVHPKMFLSHDETSSMLCVKQLSFLFSPFKLIVLLSNTFWSVLEKYLTSCRMFWRFYYESLSHCLLWCLLHVANLMTIGQGMVTCCFWTMVKWAREASSKLALLGQSLKLNTLLVLCQWKKLFGCIAFNLVLDIHNWIPHLCYSNNQSYIHLVHNPEFPRCIKHIDIQVHIVQEKQLIGEINMSYVSSEHQIVDIFAKGLLAIKFQQLGSLLKNSL